jgi:hypothetical protein
MALAVGAEFLATALVVQLGASSDFWRRAAVMVDVERELPVVAGEFRIERNRFRRIVLEALLRVRLAELGADFPALAALLSNCFVLDESVKLGPGFERDWALARNLLVRSPVSPEEKFDVIPPLLARFAPSDIAAVVPQDAPDEATAAILKSIVDPDDAFACRLVAALGLAPRWRRAEALPVIAAGSAEGLCLAASARSRAARLTRCCRLLRIRATWPRW